MAAELLWTLLTYFSRYGFLSLCMSSFYSCSACMLLLRSGIALSWQYVSGYFSRAVLLGLSKCDDSVQTGNGKWEFLIESIWAWVMNGRRLGLSHWCAARFGSLLSSTYGYKEVALVTFLNFQSFFLDLYLDVSTKPTNIFTPPCHRKTQNP